MGQDKSIKTQHHSFNGWARIKASKLSIMLLMDGPG
jgi:hypothetical protein